MSENKSWFVICQNPRCRHLQVFGSGTENPVCKECEHDVLNAVRYFGGQDMRGFDLSGVSLIGTFYACDFRGMDLSQSNIEEAEFAGCLMSDVKISGAKGFRYPGTVNSARIVGCDLHGADLPTKRHLLPYIFVNNNVGGTDLDKPRIILGRPGLGIEGCHKITSEMPPDRIIGLLINGLRPEHFSPVMQAQFRLATNFEIRKLIEAQLVALDI